MSDEIKITAGDRFLWQEFPPDHLQYPPEHRGVWVADEPMKLDSTKTNMLHWAMHRESDGAVRNWFPLNPPFLRLPPLPPPEIKPGDRFLWPEFPTEQHYPPEYQGVWVADKPTKLAQVRGQCQWRMHRESDGMIQCWFPLSPPFTSVTRLPPLPAPDPAPEPVKPGDLFEAAGSLGRVTKGSIWRAVGRSSLQDGTTGLGWDCINVVNGAIEKHCGLGLSSVWWQRYTNPLAPIESWEGLPLHVDPCPVGSRWKFKTLANQAVVTVVVACNESKTRRVQFPDGAHSLWTTEALMTEATRVTKEDKVYFQPGQVNRGMLVIQHGTETPVTVTPESPTVLTEAEYLQKERIFAAAMLVHDGLNREKRKAIRAIETRNFLGDEGYRPSISGAGGNACGLYRIK